LVHITGSFPKVMVSADGRGVVSHVGAPLLADVAEASGLVAGFDEGASGGRVRRSAHTPDRVLVDVAVMLADGGEAIADLAGQRNQPGLFGQVVPGDLLAGVGQYRPGDVDEVEAGAGCGAGTSVAAARRGRPPTAASGVCGSGAAGAGDRH
jgi:hypothetical protein